MCFNISIVNSVDVIEQQFDAEFLIDFSLQPQKHISAFTNPQVPVITSAEKQTIQPFQWGLIPHWVKDEKKANEIRRMTYNAKSETVQEKPSFRHSIESRKCLVIADGFYEWQSTVSGKVCHYITRPNEDVFAFAGIWSEWINRSTGECINSVSILTQPANQKMEKIHNVKKRQPVILVQEQHHEWLDAGMQYNHILGTSYNIDLRSMLVESPLKRC